MRREGAILSAFLASVLVAIAQVPQPLAVVTGVVLDPSHAVIPGASVFLAFRNKEVAKTSTDLSGEFRLTAVPPGQYELRVESEGFATQRKRLNIATSAPAAMRIVLAIAEQKETVTVGEPEAQVSTDAGANVDVIRLSPEQLAELPVMDGDVIAALSKLLGPSAFGADGASIIVDGLPSDARGVPISEIQEITINNDPYSAEFMRPGRARIEIITKSGSSAYHGSLAVALRDYRLDARNAFATVRSPEQHEQIDASFSGPVHKSKTDTFSLAITRLADKLEPDVYALGPAGPIIENASRRQASTYASGQYTSRIGDSTLSFRYTHFDWSDQGGGTGGFVLPGTGANSVSRYHQLYSSFHFIVSPNLVNDISLRLRKEDSSSSSQQPGVPKIAVLDAFTSGGAQVNTSGTDTSLEFTDAVSWSSKHQLLKAGINVPAFSRLASADQSNFNGTFYFSSLQDYANGRPFSFVEQTGNGHLLFWQRQVGGFFQDEVKIRRNLSLALGLRYDWQNYGANEHPPAPRLGFAWAPARSGKTVIRGGAGIFYDPLLAGAVADTLRFNGLRLRQLQLLDPGYPDPFAGTVSLATIPPNLVRFSPTLTSPYSFQYSAGVERQLRRKLTLTTTWTVVRGVDLFRSRDVNAPLPPLYLTPVNPHIGILREIESSGGLKSHSLQTTLRGNLSRFFTGMVIYEFGRAMDDTDGIAAFPANNWTTQGEWSRASFDTRHFFYVYGTFSLKNLFKLGVIFSASSGRPYNLITGLDDYHDGIPNARPPGVERNSLQGSGSATLDVRWSREFHLRRKEGPSVVAGVDAFNLLNRVNYSKFSGDLNSPFFGKAVAASPPRRIQVSLAFKF